MSLLAVLRTRADTGSDASLASLYDPHSRSFGQYETPRQWAERWGPSPASVARARALLRRAGMTVSWRLGDGWMVISGPARVIQRTFHVSIRRYVARSGRHFYAAPRDPTVPRSLAGMVAATGHLSSYPDHSERIVPVDGLRPADLLSAYDIAPLRHRGLDGTGETIAFVEIDGFRQSDFDAFTQRFGLPPMHPIIAAGGRLGNVDGEAELDLEVAHEVAPGARLVVYNCSSACTDADMVSRESLAVRGAARGIVSISIGACERAEGRGTVTAEASALDAAVPLGVSVFVASGDNGAFTCLDQDWGAPPGPGAVGVSSPASVPGVTAVGGTRLSLTPNATWYAEQVWENPAESSGSGGGRSVYFARPSWQRGPGVGTVNRRGLPDVAADADPLGSVQIVIDGRVTEAGGTSQAAPIWAGITALIDQYLRRHGRPPAGFLNPALYSLAAGTPSYPPFHDVTVGGNLVYRATPGYDLATGLGSPNAWNLARDLLAYSGGTP